MAVAAYGALVSLLNVLNNVRDRARIRNIHVGINLIESLQQGINFLAEYVELYSERKEHGDLWRQLSSLAFEAEQMFDLHVVDQLQLRSQGQKADPSSLAFNEDVERVIQQVDFIKKELLAKPPGMAAPAGSDDSSTAAFSGGRRSTVVGFDDYLNDIMDWLTSDQLDLQVLPPITGMAGIGKTTLARNIFNNAVTVKHFDLRIWLTISRGSTVHQIVSGLLHDEDVKNDGRDFHWLMEDLHEKLFDRRYLIVMDDVWGTDVWDDLIVFFPNNCIGSRVVMTTRLPDLAGSLGFQAPYFLTFLDEDSSWNLFCQTVFARDACPYPEFEELGRSIVASCRGLPMEIVVMGGHLANSDMAVESWEFVAEILKSFGDIVEDYEHCIEVLYLSYRKLPIHLRLCFLYLGAFPEDEKISTSNLVEHWIAEGFIKPISGEDSVEIGKKYIKDLTARNLIAMNNSSIAYLHRRFQEAADELHVHDLLRELCLRVWENEQFINSPKTQIFELNRSDVCCFHCGNGTSRYVTQATNLMEYVVIPSTASTESLVICRSCEVKKYSGLKRTRLVKVANIIENDNVVRELIHPTQLRYADVTVQSCFLEFVSPMLPLLWNLHTLILCSYFESRLVLPPEIWELPQLRIIQSSGLLDLVLPNPANTHDLGADFVILKNLGNLRGLCNLECTEETLNRIPNLKELDVKYKDELGDNDMGNLHSSLCNLTLLQKLVDLSVQDANLERAIFPNSLKQLFLKSCRVSWTDITIIGSLPNLEVLMLIKSGEGAEWTPVEGGFLQLKLLTLDSCNLTCLNADRVHFPMLESLMIIRLPFLEGIPSGIGDIATLHSIIINNCGELVDESAKKIWEEQQNKGNENLKIVMNGEVYLGEDGI